MVIAGFVLLKIMGFILRTRNGEVEHFAVEFQDHGCHDRFAAGPPRIPAEMPGLTHDVSLIRDGVARPIRGAWEIPPGRPSSHRHEGST
jgi:hypothetical protein